MQVLLKARKNVNQKTRFSRFESRNLLAMTESYTHVHVSLFFLEVNFFLKESVVINIKIALTKNSAQPHLSDMRIKSQHETISSFRI